MTNITLDTIAPYITDERARHLLEVKPILEEYTPEPDNIRLSISMEHSSKIKLKAYAALKETTVTELVRNYLGCLVRLTDDELEQLNSTIDLKKQNQQLKYIEEHYTNLLKEVYGDNDEAAADFAGLYCSSDDEPAEDYDDIRWD